MIYVLKKLKGHTSKRPCRREVCVPNRDLLDLEEQALKGAVEVEVGRRQTEKWEGKEMKVVSDTLTVVGERQEKLQYGSTVRQGNKGADLR